MSNVSVVTRDISEQRIAKWLREYLAKKLEVEESKVDPTVPFVELGIDSMTAVVMTGDLGDWLGFDIEPSQLFEFPTVSEFAARVSALAHARSTTTCA
jgi:acyl carrier protein